MVSKHIKTNKLITVSNKIQIVRRNCCNTIFASCVEPYCYTDDDWTKQLKIYAEEGRKIEIVTDFRFEPCTCKPIEDVNQLELFTE